MRRTLIDGSGVTRRGYSTGQGVARQLSLLPMQHEIIPNQNGIPLENPAKPNAVINPGYFSSLATRGITKVTLRKFGTSGDTRHQSIK